MKCSKVIKKMKYYNIELFGIKTTTLSKNVTKVNQINILLLED